uniref:Uncharacterized protein n=1 Tax=Trieres chinensis TaxID=1514140 RepID=A0A7S2A6D8_TRICV
MGFARDDARALLSLKAVSYDKFQCDPANLPEVDENPTIDPTTRDDFAVLSGSEPEVRHGPPTSRRQSRVCFSHRLVTAVHYRARTAASDRSSLHYSREDFVRFKREYRKEQRRVRNADGGAGSADRQQLLVNPLAVVFLAVLIHSAAWTAAHFIFSVSESALMESKQTYEERPFRHHAVGECSFDEGRPRLWSSLRL